MEYQWDPVKAKANFRKHAVFFSDAVSVLEDEWPSPFAILIPKRKNGGSHSGWICSEDFWS